MMKNFMRRIEINSKILLGKPIIAGTRIPVELIVKLVAQGWKEEEIYSKNIQFKKRRYPCLSSIRRESFRRRGGVSNTEKLSK